MSTDYFSDYQSYNPSRPSPLPADTPYFTPSPELSRPRRPSHRRSPGDSSTSPQPPRSESQDGNVYGLDPKRFTPTLHASLVSEILNLRRELDTKHRFIDDLENNLESTKTQNEHLVDQLTANTAKYKQAEQRFKSLENGTLDAVEDLVRQRDHAESVKEDLKTKLDALNKRMRKQEEEQVQSHDAWEREKQGLENERRQLERRVHVTETRLRTVIVEMNELQADVDDQGQEDESESKDTFRDSGLGNESDNNSVRHRMHRHRRNRSSISMMSRRSLGSPSKHDRAGGASKTLADELEFDEDESDIDNSDHKDEELLFDERMGKGFSTRQAPNRSPSKAKRLLGLTGPASENVPSTVLKETSEPPRDVRRSTSITDLAARMGFGRAKAAPKYVDTGVQPSPSSSPTRSSTREEGKPAPQTANSCADDNAGKAPWKSSESSHLSSQCSYMEPLSPPETPGIQLVPMKTQLNDTLQKRPVYQSSSTQTDIPMSSSGRTRLSLRPHDLQIPSISIHPPRSQPASPGEAILPPGMINASAQTDADSHKNSCDVSVQTEEIRIDQRPVRLPPHLLPSAVFEFPSDPVTADDKENRKPSVEERRAFFEGEAKPVQMPSKHTRSLPLKALALPRPILLAAEREDERQNPKEKEAPQNQASAMLKGKAKDKGPFMYAHDALDDDDQFEDVPSDMDSKDIFGTTPGISRSFMRSAFSGLPKTVPEDREISPAQETKTQSSITSRRGSDSTSRSSRPMSGSNRTSGSRTGRGSNSFRSRSPSLTSVGSEGRPPFPIPARSSSRAPSLGPSEEPPSPTPFGNALHSIHSERGPQPLQRDNLRKVKSSNTVKAHVRMSPRRRRRSPQLTPIQSMAFDGSPSKFQMPGITQPEMVEAAVQQETQTEALNAVLSNETAVEDDGLDTKLVDAIAATMVGEWMWKYVRRRKSFGIGESAQDFAKLTDDGLTASGGLRHKRWVWLSPYERTVMWSAKQPNSGSALLGKGGRKLQIKSVLDVKDDTPLPKSAATSEVVFNRSILILTPERALKFTASTMERHYLWLTALSFLAESGRGPPAIPRVPGQQDPPTSSYQSRRPSEPALSQQPQRPSTQREATKKSIMPGQTRPRLAPISVSASYAESFQSGSVATPSTLTNSPSAAPPNIRRLTAPYQRHNRKRSSTNPQLPTLSSGALSFSSTAITPTFMSAARDAVSSKASSHRQPTTSSRSSQRTSVASPDQPNFFEAVGTVRMEAFVDPHLQDGVLYVPAPAPGIAGSRRGGKRRNDSTYSATTNGSDDRRRGGYVFDEHGNDPFSGF